MYVKIKSIVKRARKKNTVICLVLKTVYLIVTVSTENKRLRKNIFNPSVCRSYLLIQDMEMDTFHYVQRVLTQ
jgi:hypothetical protein